MSEANKELASRIPLEAFNEGRLDVIDEVMSADMTDHNPLPGSPPGREGVKALIRAVRSTFPDHQNTVIRQVAEGDIVVQHIRSTGDDEGRLDGHEGDRQECDLGSRPHRPREGRQARRALVRPR